MLRGEHVLLEARVDLRRIRQHALQQRRGDRDDLVSVPAHNRDGAIQLVVGQVQDVLAEDHAQLGAGHADFRHGARRHVDIGGELVGDRGNAEA